MASTIIATGSKTIIDLSDGKSLSVYLGSNLPRTQVMNNGNSASPFVPDWSASPYLVITPVVYEEGENIALNNSNLTITYTRREGTDANAAGSALVTGESVARNVLTVRNNKLYEAASQMITYIANVSYNDTYMGATVTATAEISFVLINSGENSVVFSLYAPEGTVFVNGMGTKTIQAQAYDGASVIAKSNANFYWYKYDGGTWKALSTAANKYAVNGDTLTVYASEVPSEASYKCEMQYPKTGGAVYTDIITLIDKTDNYQLTLDSTAGTVFKNASGQTCLIARLWQNGQEVDGLKSTTYATAGAAPSTASSGEKYYYQIQGNRPETKLMRSANGSAYADVTNDARYKHSKTYTWYRRNKDGEALDNGSPFATGKVIHITSDDVDVKTVFVCEAE